MKRLFASMPMILCILFSLALLIPSYTFSYAVDPLDCTFRVYTDNEGIALSYPLKGLVEKKIPIVNLFLNQPGCYIKCHSHNPDQGAYASSSKTYVVGVIRVEGEYEHTVCVPEIMQYPDIQNDQHIKELCSKTFMCIGNSCWGTGNTGDWFGLK